MLVDGLFRVREGGGGRHEGGEFCELVKNQRMCVGCIRVSVGCVARWGLLWCVDFEYLTRNNAAKE